MGMFQRLLARLTGAPVFSLNDFQDRKAIGRYGEDLAARYLKKQGYTLMDRNVELGRNEIDLIALDKRENCVCFVEVKTRTQADAFAPESAVGPEKQQRLRNAAAVWLGQYQSPDTYYRFDVVGVLLQEGARPEISHFRNAFQ